MTATRELKPSDVLDHAATIMEYWGWAQGSFLKPSGAMCHVGAIRAASGYYTHMDSRDGWYISRTDDRCAALMQEATFFDAQAINAEMNRSVVVWNDSICESQEEAIAKLREAAELARSVGR